MSSYAKKAEGIAVVTMPYGETQERKTATCGHCGAIMYVAPGGDGTAPLSSPFDLRATKPPEPPAVCHVCWSLVCPRCHRTGECKPLLKRLDEEDASARFIRSAGL